MAKEDIPNDIDIPEMTPEERQAYMDKFKAKDIQEVDAVENAIEKCVDNLSNPTDIRMFTRLTSEQIVWHSLGEGLGRSLKFQPYLDILDDVLWKLVSLKGLGREEHLKIGVAGVNRSTQEQNSFMQDFIRGLDK